MGVSVVDQIVQERKQRKERRLALIASVRALPREDRQEVLAELHALEEADADADAKRVVLVSVPVPVRVEPVSLAPPVEPESQVTSKKAKTGSYVDQAEKLVLASPNGITTADVGKLIGQKTANADGTLRQVADTRGTIERVDGKWWPKKEATPKPTRKTHRKALLEVLAAATHPMGQGDIIAEVQRIDPNRPTESLEQDMTRMRADRLIAESGTNGRGNLYVITNAGRAALAK